MPDVVPDPVPPPGKPRIGLWWIIIVVVGGLMFAAWLYFWSTPKPSPDGREPPTPAQQANP
jgi:hypothetical protein